MEKFVKSFDQYINPFSAQLPPNQLFDIASGKSASAQGENFLLNVEKIDDLRKAFISCSSDINRFDKTIKKTNSQFFKSDRKKSVKWVEKIKKSKYSEIYLDAC